ncbi:S-layer homology domain-containing protein [Sporosalibacterium faouarense]|uniref:S-layer homology domain-containing protein n=1 Tax=Sporosalibacterium faouarense TaxID=516123 RepID=UPI00141C40D1|nr:S-layer homology domain-containing protein [Sporosalibacterium faouarense]MTI46605.1 S-layer homology domain-containing protein [Bacillota bacterium]
MKRKVALFMALVMVLTVVSTGFTFADYSGKNYSSDYDEDLKVAIVKAKNLFNITDGYDEFNYNVNSYNGKTEFRLDWNDSDGKLGSINVTIDTNGKVTDFYQHDANPEQYGPRLAKFSLNEAKEIAEKFIEKVNPESKDNIKLEDNEGILNVNSRYYNLIYIREENGILYSNNTIRVNIDNESGEVRSYYCNWEDDLKFPSPEKILTLQGAEKIYKDKIGLQLVYKFNYEDNQVKPYLIYTNLTDKNAIDAKTGEAITKGNYYRMYAGSEKAVDTVANQSSLSPAEKAAIEDMSGLLSEKEAQKIAIEELKIDDSLKVSYINLFSQWRNKGEFTWSIRFEDDSEKTVRSVSVNVDARTGEIQSFNKYNKHDEDDKAIYNKEQSMEIAEEFIKNLQSDKFKKVEYVTWQEPRVYPLDNQELPRQYSLNYQRKANGAYVYGDGFNVSVDTITGEVTNYNYTWFKGDLPTTVNAMNMDEAFNTVMKEIGMELKYISDYSQNENIKIENESKTPEIKLVYAMKKDKPLTIDANTGDILTYNGDVYQEETVIEYTDIDDSYAKSQIEVLAQYGISLPGDKFMPKSEITQRDFLYLLAKANSYYIAKPYSEEDEFDKALYDRLKNAGIIKDEEIAPQETITNEEAVKFIIRSLGYDKVASIEGIYVVNFKDADKISSELKGHVAIANGLGIINGYDGYLYPQAEINREQGAVVIYNYLNSNSK